MQGKTALVRVDFNVPMEGGRVEDDFRIQKAVPTIKFLSEAGMKVILITHLGKGEESLAPVAAALAKYIPSKFIPEVIGPSVTATHGAMAPGDVILLENLRQNAGEQGKDMAFAKDLAALADIYVNEAFPVSHRDDASITILPNLLPAYAGFQLESEVKNLSVAFEHPAHPFLFILGGAKFDTKLPIITRYLDTADNLFIGGAMLNDFLKAKGLPVGQSLVSEDDFGIDKLLGNPKLIIPENVVVKTADGALAAKAARDIAAEDSIIDLGQGALDLARPLIASAKLILWNGPLGKYEDGGAEATKEILKLIADATAGGAVSIIGGGDTAAVISEMHMEDAFTFVSTGGGAALDFLAYGTLPGIKALG